MVRSSQASIILDGNSASNAREKRLKVSAYRPLEGLHAIPNQRAVISCIASGTYVFWCEGNVYWLPGDKIAHE
jgi:hypothetical protein